jgi:hypothetical protein
MTYYVETGKGAKHVFSIIVMKLFNTFSLIATMPEIFGGLYL